MESIETYLKKILVAGVGAAELGYEKLGRVVDECVKRGEVTVEKGRAMNEELKRRRAEAPSADADGDFDVSNLSPEERSRLLEKLLAMRDEQK